MCICHFWMACVLSVCVHMWWCTWLETVLPSVACAVCTCCERFPIPPGVRSCVVGLWPVCCGVCWLCTEALSTNVVINTHTHTHTHTHTIHINHAHSRKQKNMYTHAHKCTPTHNIYRTNTSLCVLTQIRASNMSSV